MRAGQAELVAQRIRQRGARFDRDGRRGTVDGEMDGTGRRHAASGRGDIGCARQRPLQQHAEKIAAIGGFRVDIIGGIDRIPCDSRGLQNHVGIDPTTIEDGLDTGQPHRTIGNADHPDMRIMRQALRVDVVECGNTRQRKISAAAREFLEGPAPRLLPERQTYAGQDFVGPQNRAGGRR